MQTAQTNIVSAELPTSHHSVPPLEVRRLEKGRGLRLEWEDGLAIELEASVLRDNSQSAGSKRLRIRGLDVPSSFQLAIEAVKPVGSYALNISFSDGYDRGIYPWALLRELAEQHASGAPENALSIDDFLIGN
ncbi:gamma-butyrobetaine hydroxylase-like domain-containing protein [Roseibium sp.]|uniref:gamma-butyrobetaine hydroxylase-like domain-containing protein n=1 Tax=Roseibium sp. TaxID=1936156 RepID=UPI003A98311F